MNNPYPRTTPLPDDAPFMLQDPRKPYWLDPDYIAALESAANTSRNWRHEDAQRIATLESDCEAWAKQADTMQAEIERLLTDMREAALSLNLQEDMPETFQGSEALTILQRALLTTN